MTVRNGWVDALFVPVWLVVGGVALWRHNIWNAADCALLAIYAARCFMDAQDQR